MKTKLVVQVRLRSPNTEDGSFSVLTCYVDDPDIRKGWRVRLKDEDPERWWKVVWAGESVDAATLPAGWDAGGIRSTWH
jgi:hypothetical protein